MLEKIEFDDFKKRFTAYHKNKKRENWFTFYNWLVLNQEKLGISDCTFPLGYYVGVKYITGGGKITTDKFEAIRETNGLDLLDVHSGIIWAQLKNKIYGEYWDSLDRYFYQERQLHKTKREMEEYIDIVLNCVKKPNIEEEMDSILQDKYKCYLKRHPKKVKQIRKISTDYGVYGIYEDEELVYIGMTMRNFEERWEEHKENLKNHSKALKLYSLLDTNKTITCKVLINAAKIQTNSKLTERDVKSMELALIIEHQPKYNFAGRVMEYKF